MSVALVNTSRALSVRLVTPWRGVWFADVDLDPDDAKNPPSGVVTLTVGAATLTGTVDPRGSGRFVSSVRLRIVGGGGGWDKPVSPQHFHNDAGVKSTEVYAATAGQIGETITDPAPVADGVDFVRSAEAASLVTSDVDWYVDLAGVTQIGPRPAATPDKTLEILGFDPNTQRLDVTSDAIVLPGTTFTDARFDGTLTARDVEQLFDTDGSRASIWCGVAEASRLASALESMVVHFSGRTYLRTYAYRFINDAGGGRLNLQAVDKEAGLPDVLPISVWPGMAGLSAKLTPSQTVRVAFLEGDPRQPIVVGFDGNLPSSITVDATDTVKLGGEGGSPVARLGDAVVVYLPPTMPIVGTLILPIPVPGTVVPFTAVLTVSNPAMGIIQDGSAKVTAT